MLSVSFPYYGIKEIPIESYDSMGMGMQDIIDITHLNSIDPIKRYIVITTYITAFMEPILCVSSCLHDSKLAA